MKYTVAIFGECQEGRAGELIPITSLPQALYALGNPTESGLGVHFAIHSLLYDRAILFYKVLEEGFSPFDYAKGFKYLEKYRDPLKAIALPGVGDPFIINEAKGLADLHKSILITTEKDLYDLITH